MQIKNFICSMGAVFCLSNVAFAVSPDAVAAYNKGIDFSEKGHYKESIIQFRRAISIDPAFTDAYYNIGSIYDYLGDYDNALLAYQKLLSKNSEDTETMYRCAEIYCKKGKYQQALGYIYKIPVENEKYADAQNLYRKIVNQLDQNSKPEQASGNKKISAKTNKAKIFKNFNGPTGIAKDNNGNLYVANYSSNSIYIVSPEGKRQTLIKGSPLKGPIGLAFDKSDNLFVANYLSGEIVKITPGGKTLTLAKGIKKPYYLYIDQNTLYISAQGNDTVIKMEL